MILWAVEALAITVSISSTPPPQTIRPDADVARVTLAVQRDGQPLSHGRIQVKVTAPPRPSWLSADFPVVEATTLLDLASDLQDGAFSFDYLFPIRGAYTFDVALQPVADSPQFDPVTIQQSWQLHENPAEIRNVWLLVLGLFMLGGVFGLVLARSAQAKSALLMTVMLISTGLVMQAEGDVRGQAGAAKTQQVVRGESGWMLQVDSTPAQGTVGEQVRFDIVLTKDGEVFAEATELSLELHHIEDDKSIFKTAILASKGETSQHLQFFDGAPHRVNITARPVAHDQAAQPLQAVFDMEVNGIQPPL
ncbi:hypothetical protein, partial [Candidatus Entotheonella palauensis]|uniref:hypothetical protein n=1 Tax=Candidatus Entotheonella palauensis TaxID=93172 RepID=UPI0011777DB2